MLKQQLERFAELLLQENARQNLVRVDSAEELFQKHFQDVLGFERQLSSLVKGNGVDMGSGGGIPGIVLALLFPGSHFSLFESELRKASFLERAALLLGMENVTVHPQRMESVPTALQQAMDFATARALAPVRVCLEYAAPYLRVGGKLLLFKGPAWQQELQQANRAMDLLHFQQMDMFFQEVRWEETPFQRNLLVLQKTAPTPPGFPRRAGVAARKPLS
ncbi:MAG TPA: 16S rRNA (guanine(527)-N(7))-methyltransferase RsmG [Thermotogota bacterium]|mgnify:CR=1 FL=1|nr:16S rRNA (guanine(527)-N(7))-methyltransferase RsmG [Thermotogota bacterium]HRW91924.1 16S rRNA (guanine(527)-N(7))-methyltransferase RsmG [Thermotogota bacterium]